MAAISDIISLSEVDVEKTVSNGKRVFEQYQPLIEKRIKQLKIAKMNSTSLVVFSGKSHRNSSDKMFTNRLIWNEDQIGKIIQYILKLEKKEKIIGSILKCKLFYGMNDKEISLKMNIPERTIRYNKAKAFYELAVYSNKVEFIPEQIIHFVIYE